MLTATNVRVRPSGRRFGSLTLAIFLSLRLGDLFADTDPASSIKALKKLSVEELMDIEVTSVSKRPEKLSETASAIQVITGEDIRRSGATSLPEALRLASNLEVAQVDSRQWAISARGFNSTVANKLLVLIDGRTIYSPLHSGVFWDAQDTLMEDLDRIEVISGPGATQWGSNAVNGVINIITKNAKETQGSLVLGGGGNELLGFGGVRQGGILAPNVYYRVYAKYFERDATQRASGLDAANDWHMSQGGFRLDAEAAADNLFTLQGDLYQSRIDQANLPAISLSGGNVLGRWTHTSAAGSSFELQAYYDRTHRSLPGALIEDVDTYDVDFQHHIHASQRHDLVWGFGFRLIDDDVVNSPVLAFLPAHVSRQWYSAFAQDEITLIQDRLNLTLGTKLEHNDYTGLEFQPSGRLAWRPSQIQTLWAAVSRAVRTPSRIDRELYAPRDPPFTLIVGTSNFLSEELLAYELGYRAQPHPRLSLSIAAFYHDYDRLRSVEQLHPPAPLPIVLGNGQQGSSSGVELTVDAHIAETWRLQAGYTQIHLRLQNKPGSTATAPTNTDPAYQFSLRSSLDLPNRFEFDITYRSVAGITSQNVRAYDELDVRLGWRPTSALEFSLVGQNLLHDHHAEFNALASRQEIERSVYGKASWRW